ncbi:MAG: branched-chain amino acid ABC transporter permease [Candidatus Methanomethylicaceae archaeon]
MDLSALYQCLADTGCFTNQIVSALVYGVILFLMASGLTLVFGVLGVLNFAHGSFYMLGAYFLYTFSRLELAFWLTIVIACAGMGVFALVFERVFLNKVYGANLLYQLLMTYGFVLMLDDIVKLVWGYQFVQFGVPEVFLRPPVVLDDAVVPFYYLFVIAIGVFLVVTLYSFLWRTKYGKIIRATAYNDEMVMALGIDTRLVKASVFALGGFLAALSGALAAPIRSIYPGMGGEIVVDCFIVVVVGGLGSLTGALCAALIIGLVKSFGIIGFPLFEEGTVFALMAGLLLIRPQGLLGRAEV